MGGGGGTGLNSDFRGFSFEEASCDHDVKGIVDSATDVLFFLAVFLKKMDCTS